MQKYVPSVYTNRKYFVDLRASVKMGGEYKCKY